MYDKKVKIVHIVEGFEGGIETYMSMVLPQLVKRGFDITLIGSLNRCSSEAKAKISELRASGINVHITPMCRAINPIRDIVSFAMIMRLLLKDNFDIVHTHCSKAGALGRIAGVLAGKKVRLHTPHCFAFTRCNGKSKRKLYFSLERIFGRLTTKLVAVSKSEVETALRSRIVPFDKCSIVPNGLSNKYYKLESSFLLKDIIDKTSLTINEDTKIVTTACRLVEYKGIFRFIKAAVLSKTPNTIFVIAGDGELRYDAEKFIKKNKLSNKVILLGHVRNTEQLYSLSDIVALCSDAEAQPYLLLEAMRARCPIVATSVVGNKDLISHRRTGLLVEPSEENIAEAIDELLSDKDTSKKYAENAYEYFSKHHTLETQISGLTNIYRNVS